MTRTIQLDETIFSRIEEWDPAVARGVRSTGGPLGFMARYTEQWNALDLIAERIRALGHPAPGTLLEA